MSTTEAVPCTGAADLIATRRERIDALDAEIIQLLQERAAVSREIQQARLASGGPRIQHSREMQVIARYAAAFDRVGTALGMNVLEVCRGRR